MMAADAWATYPNVHGAFWPCASDGDGSLAWVETVDFPDDPTAPRYESDSDAAWAVAQATGWPLRYAELEGPVARGLAPYVQPFAHD